MDTIRALLAGLIDYAGLFPPARLEMTPAVRNYARYYGGEHAWMLGSFVVPAQRLDEFERAARGLLPPAGRPAWPLSVLLGPDFDAEIRRVRALNSRYSGTGVRVVAVETPVTRPEEINHRLRETPDGIEPFFELPVSSNPAAFLQELAGTRGRAKIRTGGITQDAFPTEKEVARFLATCNEARVGFKATAGLHHPVRGRYPLTYEAGSSVGLMHGFLNVFLAAAFLRAGRLDARGCLPLLMENRRRAFSFTETSANWRSWSLSAEEVGQARREFARSYGSCSFEEPIEDLHGMNLS